MSGVLSQLEPKEVFQFFETLSDIPRGSSHEEKVSDWFVQFANERGYEVFQDDLHNILIKAPGTPGYENSPTLIFHGHMDMVCKKTIDVEHDFLNEGLKLYTEDGFVRAKGTTLGADNGIGISYFLALLDSKEIPHPPIEMAITVMEEMGKVGGEGFHTEKLTGTRMLDMNWHMDDHILAGCGGDVSVKYSVFLEREAVADAKFYSLDILGLIGGHCEFDIVLERGNSIKLLARVLNNILSATNEVRVATISGGVQNNVIPSEANAILAIKDSEFETVKAIVLSTYAELKDEYNITDPDVKMELTESDQVFEQVFTAKMTEKLVKSIMLLPNGVISMSFKIEGISECSNNIGIMTTEENAVEIVSTITSIVTTRKHEVVKEMLALADLVGDGVKAEQIGTDAPEWIYNPDSYMLKIATEAYKAVTGEEPEVYAMPASLELGLFQDRVKGLDIVSVGTVTHGVHTPSEELGIESVGKVWKIFKEMMKNLKD
ncbi:MAG: beta-Ala-His dipeptidase [Lachnospiraceae bacterium]|nr:beta-Ala-His dipeptidase [Lachnospiraceae bacterium]MDD3615492.1 beta-Ala-His dipeptidase [Lachnospiraceae bacterium]